MSGACSINCPDFARNRPDACGWWCRDTRGMTVLAPKLGQFARDYPDVVLDVTTDDSRVNLVAAGFDAGTIRGLRDQASGIRAVSGLSLLSPRNQVGCYGIRRSPMAPGPRS